LVPDGTIPINQKTQNNIERQKKHQSKGWYINK